jgi:hypothetical protein
MNPIRLIWHHVVHGYRFERMERIKGWRTLWVCTRCGHRRIT